MRRNGLSRLAHAAIDEFDHSGNRHLPACLSTLWHAQQIDVTRVELKSADWP